MQKIITYNLSDNFIDKLAEFIEENYLKQGKDISKLAFVFGGKRPALFLKKELSKKIGKGFYSPAFFSIDEFVEYTLSKKEIFSVINDLDACYIIYNLAKKFSPDVLTGRQNFSQFLPWAREILSFIEQLDLEDIQPEKLKNIQLKASIGYDVPENINTLLERIICLRQAMQEELKKKKSYSRGLIYLLASDSIEQADFSEFEQIIFCGLFYLHKTESNIIRSIYEKEKAVFFFQGSEQEWSVLGKTAKDFSISIKPPELKIPEFNLSIQAGFDVHSEACLVRQGLKKIKNPDDTVIVLPESGNIIPLLSEISDCLDNFNVSMGYPLKRSSVYSLFECVFKAQNTRKDSQYYTKDYLNVLSHPLVKNLRLLPDSAVIRVLAHKIEEILLGMEETPLGGSLFISLSDIGNSRELFDSALKTMRFMGLEVTLEELKNVTAVLHDILFKAFEGIGSFYEFALSLEKILDILIKKSFLRNYPLNLKMAERIFQIKEELISASFNKEPFDKEDIFKIFENKLDNELISFSGSPLKGLQILGLFETRSLNFENVLIMDMNEAVLPNLKIYEPLIPREVMISLGLNRLEKEEEIQRYQFKRLISGAKNVCLIYQERNDKEKSRFIEELIWERQKKQGSLDVLPVPKANFQVKVLPKHLEIEKGQKIIDFLKNKEYSASSINTYMQCPLRFYYQYVLGLKEKEDLLEEPEGRHIGTFVHNLLEETYSGFVGKKPDINEKFKKYFFDILDKKFSQDFERKMKSDSFLIKEIINFRMSRFLENEKKREVAEVISLEKKFKGSIQIGENSFKFQAIIDRIDSLSDKSILVLDYKTGGVDILPEIDVEKIEQSCASRQEIKKTVKSFQLPLYLYLIDSQPEFQQAKTNACLYSIKDTDQNQGIKYLFKKEEQFANKDEIMQAYLKALEVIFAEILDPQVPFKADEETPRLCQTCPFFYLCR
ncbi:MAG: PD-(D/E)XK nuclease family protein [Candidatus Omnitrophota bacterium]